MQTPIRQFKDFAIKRNSNPQFIGDKISINQILNREITVEYYRIVDSKFTDNGIRKRLDLQIIFKDKKRIVFTSALNLIDEIAQVPQDSFPFTATIIEENDRFQFT